MSPLARLFRPRLALRFYVVGVAQVLAVTLGFFALLEATRPAPRGPRPENVELAAEHVAPVVGDRAALQARLQKLSTALFARITVLDPDGAVVATSAPPGDPTAAQGAVAQGAAAQGAAAQGAEVAPGSARATGADLARAPRCPDPPVPPAGGAGPMCVRAPLPFPDRRTGRLDYFAEPRPPPPPIAWRIIPIVLFVVAVSSLLLTRSLAAPLRRMSAAARAFGEGDLRARAAVDRRDELGDVARAFDEMAERVTELLRAERELLANVSHELRTPLTRIRIALDIAAEGDAATARESLADITADLDELERLIADILTAARLDLGDDASAAGGLPLRRKDVDVTALLEQAASRFRRLHPDRPLEADVPDELPAGHGDPILLRRVFDNLLENAHKYTESAASPIRLVASIAGAGAGTGASSGASGGAGHRSLQVDVIDSGIGIAAADLPHIFRPFFRADRSRTRATGGLGLGLALAKRIVEAHRGTIEVTSQLHEGTRVRVTLPLPLAGEGAADEP